MGLSEVSHQADRVSRQGLMSCYVADMASFCPALPPDWNSSKHTMNNSWHSTVNDRCIHGADMGHLQLSKGCLQKSPRNNGIGLQEGGQSTLNFHKSLNAHRHLKSCGSALVSTEVIAQYDSVVPRPQFLPPSPSHPSISLASCRGSLRDNYQIMGQLAEQIMGIYLLVITKVEKRPFL